MAPDVVVKGIVSATDNDFKGLAGTLSGIARTLQAEPTCRRRCGPSSRRPWTTSPEPSTPASRWSRGRRSAPSNRTSHVVEVVDRLQYDLWEGPCVDAISEHETCRVGDVAQQPRWPAFGPAAAENGIHSLLSYRLFVSDRTLGALNLYSSRVDAFDERTEDEGQLFAAHAAIALVGAQREAQLGVAVESRALISTAKGILMERHDIDDAAAFRLLVEASQTTNIKLHDVARWLVDNRGQA